MSNIHNKREMQEDSMIFNSPLKVEEKISLGSNLIYPGKNLINTYLIQKLKQLKKLSNQ